MASKTPLSLLQEILCEQGTTCQYIDSSVVEERSKKPIFTYTLNLELFGKSYIAKGSAYKKQVAKQETARNMLLKLSADRSDVKALLDKYKGDFEEYSRFQPALPSVERSERRSPCDDEAKYSLNDFSQEKSSPTPQKLKVQDEEENPIDVLEEHLDDVGLTPNYIFVQVESNSPSKLFTCSLELFGGLLHVEAIGMSKHIAKMRAAEIMLKCLNEEQSVLKRYVEESDVVMKEEIKKDSNIKNNIDVDFENVTSQGQQACKKTPVALLQEYLAHHRYKDPNYEISDPILEGSSLRPWFHCKLELASILNEKICAKGTGLTKKQAKHKTAENMLLELSKKIADVEIFLKNNEYHKEQEQLENDCTKAGSTNGNDSNSKNDHLENSSTGNDSRPKNESSKNDSLGISSKHVTSEFKNPISILQEFLQVKQLTPLFIEKKLSDTPPEFHCQLDLYDGKFHVEAKGRNKKEAKIETSNKMLLQLSQVEPGLKSILEQNDLNKEAAMECSVNHPNDSISLLYRFCRYHNFSEPVYYPFNVVGEPHMKTFGFKCEVDHIIVEGMGNRKSTAKRESAEKMRIKLQEELEKIEESEKSSKPTKYRYRDLTPSGIDYAELNDIIKKYKPHCADESPDINTKSSAASSSSLHVARDKLQDSARSVSSSEINGNEGDKNLLKIQKVELEDPSTLCELYQKEVKDEDSLPKVVQVESKNVKYKMILNSEKLKSLKSLADIKKYLANQRKSMDSSLNITNILNNVRMKKNLQDNDRAWFEYLGKAELQELTAIVEVLQQDKDIFISVNTQEQPNSYQMEYYTTCRLNLKEFPTTFRSLDPSKDASQRKVYGDLLKYLTSEFPKKA